MAKESNKNSLFWITKRSHSPSHSLSLSRWNTQTRIHQAKTHLYTHTFRFSNDEFYLFIQSIKFLLSVRYSLNDTNAIPHHVYILDRHIIINMVSSVDKQQSHDGRSLSSSSSVSLLLSLLLLLLFTYGLPVVTDLRDLQPRRWYNNDGNFFCQSANERGGRKKRGSRAHAFSFDLIYRTFSVRIFLDVS